MSNYEKIFKSESVWKSIASMAIPSLVTILVMVFYNMADMFFIGQLGNTAMVAAVSIVGPVFSLIQGLATMLGSGGSILMANAFGAGDHAKVKSYSSLCFWSAIVLGAMMTVLVLLLRSPLLTMLGTTEDMWQYSMTYLTILAIGIPLMLPATCLGNLVRTEGAVKEGLFGNLAGTITNIVLDPVFILGFHWGVAGAAIATVIGNGIAVIAYLLFILRKSRVMSLRLSDAMQHPAALGQILALGLPNAVSTILSGFASTFSNRLLSGYGSDAIAAMAAAGKTSMLIGMIMIGICMGCQPLLSYSYGARDQNRMKELLQKLAILTLVLGFGFAVACFLFRGPIIRLFLKQDSVIQMAEGLVIFLIAGSPFLGIYQLSTNFLQAARNAPAAIVVSILRQGALLIPLLYVMHALFGFTGIAAAHTISDIGAAGISLIFFLREYKKFQKSCSVQTAEEKSSCSPSHGRRMAS